MVCIRIFDTREEAERARDILKEGDIASKISEDKFNGVPIQEFDVPARFRLFVDDKDYHRTAKFLADKLKD